ncbi:glycosyltransferase family 39 protein [candidate division FCPU426 bacterium]|nr:glycosyltransferase family 39 protein [candidate division FCPU426 bacterium]
MQVFNQNRKVSIGWVVMLAVAVGLMLAGQKQLLGSGNVIIGIFNTLSALVVLLWLVKGGQYRIPLLKALLVGAVVMVYNKTAYQSSFGWDSSTKTVMLLMAASMGLVLLFHPPLSSGGPERSTREPSRTQRLRSMGLMLVLAAGVMALVIVLAKKYVSVYDYTAVMNWFFVLRWHGVIGDIASATFREWGKLWLPSLYLLLLLFSYAMILKGQKWLGAWKSLALLYLLGNAGGLTIAYLSASGWHILPLQVKSVHYNFYAVAKEFNTFGEVWSMVGTYATKEIFRYVSFPATHPPFHIVLNWLLIQLTGDNLYWIAIGLGALAWTGVFPMYLIGKELYNRELGFYTAGLYMVMPATLILNHITLDALTATLTAWALALIIIGCRRKRALVMILAGLAVAGIAATNYVTPLIMPALMLMAVYMLRNEGFPQRGFWPYVQAAGLRTLLFLAGIAVPYLLVEISTGWRFDYLAMIKHVMYYVNKHGGNLHPWFVGAWLAWFSYFNFVGVVGVGLYLVRWKEIFQGDWKNDVLPWLGLVTMLIPCVMGVGRQETEREYMLFNIFMAATAALALWQGKQPLRYMLKPGGQEPFQEMGGGWRVVFLAMLALSYINTVAIQMLVVDHW